MEVLCYVALLYLVILLSCIGGSGVHRPVSETECRLGADRDIVDYYSNILSIG
jgi:hypothetical protein